jgi:hypothetical protein
MIVGRKLVKALYQVASLRGSDPEPIHMPLFVRLPDIN